MRMSEEGDGIEGYFAGSPGLEHAVTLDETLAQRVTLAGDPHSWTRAPSDPLLWRPEADGVFLLVFPSRERLNGFLDRTGYTAFVPRDEPRLEAVSYDELVEAIPGLGE